MSEPPLPHRLPRRDPWPIPPADGERLARAIDTAPSPIAALWASAAACGVILILAVIIAAASSGPHDRATIQRAPVYAPEPCR